jgi:hypothetical protein
MKGMLSKKYFPSNHDFVASPLLTHRQSPILLSPSSYDESCRFGRRIKEVHLNGPKPILLLPEVLWAA